MECVKTINCCIVIYCTKGRGYEIMYLACFCEATYNDCVANVKGKLYEYEDDDNDGDDDDDDDDGDDDDDDDDDDNDLY